ncbi:hypothetical protein BDC45DRAFT_499679 [Circinella umbellata]|nr:hypothetical protein BDC45DRAFT_499679 [Circinella umbellata]
MSSSNRRGGGAMKTSRKERRSLALRAQQPGRVVTVTSSPIETKKVQQMEDDDIAMGGTGKKQKKKRFSPYNSRQRAQHVQVKQSNKPIEKIDILVGGFAPGSEHNVIPYLQQKSKKQWIPLDVKVDQGQMLLSVDGPTIAHSIIRLNGYIYGTQPLQIRLFNESTSLSNFDKNELPSNLTPKKTSTMDTLRDFLRSRWNAEGHYLNLDDMASDTSLKKAQIRPPGANNASPTVGPALMKLAGEMFENVISISFANNRFRNVQQVSTMTQFLPSIRNLSLENNVITSFSGLDAICGSGKLKHLRELVLRGNPLKESEVKQRGDNRGYVRNAVKQFPSLELLDGELVSLSEEEKQMIQKTRRILPLGTQPFFFDNENSQKVAYEFLTRFLQLFDTDRTTLVSIYDSTATFSISTLLKLRNAKKKVRGRQKQRLMEDDDTKMSWTDLNRNLTKNSSKSKHLYSGPEMIGTVLQKLPTTIHDLSQPKDFIVDAFQYPLGINKTVLQVTIYGEFKEADNPLPYSFDRTFLLLPAPSGSPAATMGSPYSVLSDMLYIKDYCSITNRIGSD